jgi:UDP-N-acetylmuramyl pentapeptide synthase
MDFLLSVIQPDIGIITKLDTVHSQNFPWGVEEYWQDKTKLLLASKIKTYFPWNDDFLQKQSTLFWKNTSEIFTQKISINFEKDNKTIIQKLKYKEKEISINLVGEENIEYTKLALDILGYLDFWLSQECYSFNFILHSGRFNILDYGERVYIDSTYNASPESMKKVIKNTQTLKKEMYPDFEHIYVLWDMRELWDSSQEAHKSLAFHILRSKAIFTIWPEMYSSLVPELHHQNYSGEIHSSLSALEIWKNLKKYTTKNKESKYIILFKGSQNTIFTEESLALQLPASQRKNLVRQTQDWKQKKDIFFKSI